MDEQLKEYRAHLVMVEEKSQEAFDKAVLSLTGGALGISMAFLSDIVGPGPAFGPNLLLVAWICWVLSITSIFWSFYTSRLAHRAALEKVDKGETDYSKLVGIPNRFTGALNLIAGILFVFGLTFMGFFVKLNLGG